jgi:hypothetical protein
MRHKSRQPGGVRFERTGDAEIDAHLEGLEKRFERIPPKGPVSRLGEALRTEAGLERRVMSGLSRVVADLDYVPPDSDWAKTERRLIRRNSGLLSNKELAATTHEIVDETRYLMEHVPVEVVSAILKSCRNASDLEDVALAVEKRTADGGAEDFLANSHAAVGALVKKRGRNLKKTVRRVGAGLGLAAAAVGLYVLATRESPEEHYSLEHYLKTSPMMSRMAEKYYPSDKSMRVLALEYLDRLDSDENKRDGVVMRNWTRYQWDDLQGRVLAGYDFAAAEKYNQAYMDNLGATMKAVGELAKDGRPIAFEELAGRLSKFRMVHINEEHYNPSHVRFEADVVEALSRDKPLRLGMEHFDTDSQSYVDRYFAGNIGIDVLLRHMQANMDAAAFFSIEPKLMEYEPFFDRIRALNKSGRKIRVIGIEDGYNEQEVRPSNDLWLRDKDMSQKMADIVAADKKAGVDARYATITGKAHAGCPRHLPKWIHERTGLESATVVFGDQTFGSDVTEFMEKSRAAPDPALKAEIASGNFFFIQSGEGDKVEVKSLGGK